MHRFFLLCWCVFHVFYFHPAALQVSFSLKESWVGFITEPLCCEEFVCSSCVCVGSLWVFPPALSRDVRVGFSCFYKPPWGVNVSVKGLYRSALRWTGLLSRVNPTSFPMAVPSAPLKTPQWMNGRGDGWPILISPGRKKITFESRCRSGIKNLLPTVWKRCCSEAYCALQVSFLLRKYYIKCRFSP